MGLSAKLLGTGEQELLHLRTHGKTMIGPALLLCLIAVFAGVALAVMPISWQPWAGWAVLLVSLAFAIPGCLLPLLRWRTTTYTITTHRLITRRGILTKTGHDLPLNRISNVAYDQGLIDRMLGCGTLILTTSAEAPVTLNDIPRVEAVGVRISNLLFGAPPRSVQG